MSVIDTIKSCREAIADTVGGTKIKCKQYSIVYNQERNIAAVGIPKIVVSEIDQSYGIYRVNFPIEIYHRLDNAMSKNIEQAETNIELILDRLGTNRTLGGQVAWSEVADDINSDVFQVDKQTVLLTIINLVVTPFANTARGSA